jgi:hypothetical protein
MGFNGGFEPFCKELKESKDSLRKRQRGSVGGNKRGGGGFAKPPSLSSPSVQNRGGDWGRPDRPAAAIAGALGHDKGRRVGGMGRRLRRFDSHPHIGLRRCEEAAPRAAADCRRCWLGVVAFEGSREREKWLGRCGV